MNNIRIVEVLFYRYNIFMKLKSKLLKALTVMFKDTKVAEFRKNDLTCVNIISYNVC
jgi:hypothetical protein